MTTLRQLRFLVALDETLNFSLAAERCFVTQPTLSTGLKELEEILGVQLAERTRHSVQMTAFGLEAARRAREILAQVQDLENRAKQEATTGTSLLRLGAIPTVGPFLMPKALPHIRAAYPDMQIFLREELTQGLVEGLLDGRLDLILIALPHDLPPSFATETLFEDGYQLAAPKGHDLTRLPVVEGPDLQDRKLLLLEKGHCLQRHALSSFPAIQLGRDEEFAATSLATLISMVEQGLGLTLLPNLAVAAGVARGYDIDLTDVPKACPRKVAIAWRKSTGTEALFHDLGALLLRTWKEMVGL